MPRFLTGGTWMLHLRRTDSIFGSENALWTEAEARKAEGVLAQPKGSYLPIGHRRLSKRRWSGSLTIAWSRGLVPMLEK